jgi:hypothetical protein
MLLEGENHIMLHACGLSDFLVTISPGTFQGRKHAKIDQICLFWPTLAWFVLVMVINSLQRD